MALTLDYNVCTYNCKTLIYTEKTGAYSASNLTGWGAPNATIASATSATLQVYNNSNVSLVTLDLFTTGLVDPNDSTVTHTWPNSSYTPTSFNEYQGKITNLLLGYASTASIPDGVYTFVYTVVANGTTYIKTKYYYHFCTVQCCVDKQFAKIPDDTFCCDSSALAKAIKMKALLEGMKKAAQCFQKERFSRLLLILQNICAGDMCDCN